MTQRRGERRPHQVSRDGQVRAAVEFDEDNKAKIALAKTATFEDLLEALAVVDPGMQQIIDEATPQALEMIEAGAPIDTPADRQRMLERARANQRHQEDRAVVQAQPARPSFLLTAVWLVPAALLFLALVPLPHGFYVLLRLVVCGAATFLTYHEYRTCGRVSGWALALAAVALLFNPLVPVHLTREIWAPIDVLSGVLLLVHWHRRRQRPKR